MLRYTPGKMDWLANWLPSEGSAVNQPRVGHRTRRDVPTCRLDEPVEKVRERVRSGGGDVAVVVNHVNVVMGVLRGKAFDAAPGTSAERVMEPGPATIRPHVKLSELTDAQRKRELTLVTTSDGELLGILQLQ